MNHNSLVGLDIHRAFTWIAANLAARNALVVVAADIYKLCWQVDTGVAYALTNHAPVTWQALGGSGGGSAQKIVFRGHRNTNQAGLSTVGGFVVAQLNAKDIDTNNFYDAASTFQFKPTGGVARYYQISYSLFCQATALTYSIGCVRKNGVDQSYSSQGTPQTNAQRNAGIDTVLLNGSTDYLELGIYTEGTAVTLVGGSAAQSTCSIIEVDPV